jgi:CHASE2 domain-containing sensor protein
LFSWFNLSPDYLIINTTNPRIKFKIPLSKDNHGQDYLFVRIFTVYPKYSYSLADILKNKIQYPESIFSDKTVFVGATDNTLNDVKVSYLGLIPGVSFHINSFLSAYSKVWTFKAPLGRSFLIIVMLFVI